MLLIPPFLFIKIMLLMCRFQATSLRIEFHVCIIRIGKQTLIFSAISFNTLSICFSCI